jgi:hypothetical protein
VVGRTQGQQLCLMFFVDFLSNYNSGLYLEAFNGSLYLEAFNGSNSLVKQGNKFPLPSVFMAPI